MARVKTSMDSPTDVANFGRHDDQRGLWVPRPQQVEEGVVLAANVAAQEVHATQVLADQCVPLDILVRDHHKAEGVGG